MIDTFQTVVYKLLELLESNDSPQVITNPNFSIAGDRTAGETLRLINTTFLIALCGDHHPAASEAREYLQRKSRADQWGEIAGFYLEAILAIENEISLLSANNPQTASRLDQLARQIEQGKDNTPQQLVELFWSFFHPEATGIWGQEESRIAALRDKRKIRITESNLNPLTDPARQVLFTSNALLTLPSENTSLDELNIDASLRKELTKVRQEAQIYWYDHPIQIGVEPEKNEVLYGLIGLQEALDYELQQGHLNKGDQLTCLLSVSVTHTGLHSLAREYLTTELQRGHSLPDLRIFVFTEDNCQDLIREVLAPAARHYLGAENAEEKLHVFGVDGAYGRHYTFLKAIAALWNVLIEPQIKATFKIDLDQVFPQEVLRESTGMSAFEHLKSPLWGALGLDSNDQTVELGMIAGALVNEDDIQRDLFTPDVSFPPSDRDFSLDEWVFFSQLPQALTTEAEMMTRYDNDEFDGQNSCIQRVHVTGGTNGILVESLKRFRPFTPSFIGRAEDQAYILSTMADSDPKLGYLHQSGLIMRHDKQAFAQEAIQAAQVGKLIGDYERILYFSAYARAINHDLHLIKDYLDPFTGSFISYIPTTLTLLRFALKAEALFEAGQYQLGEEFIDLGSQRISQAMEFANTRLERQYQLERGGWALYYETLLALEKGLHEGDPFAEDLRQKAKTLVSELKIQFENSSSSSD
jgi:hypothetical protein